jgi:hypothetical protein
MLSRKILIAAAITTAGSFALQAKAGAEQALY